MPQVEIQRGDEGALSYLTKSPNSLHNILSRQEIPVHSVYTHDKQWTNVIRLTEKAGGNNITVLSSC